MYLFKNLLSGKRTKPKGHVQRRDVDKNTVKKQTKNKQAQINKLQLCVTAKKKEKGESGFYNQMEDMVDRLLI